MQKNKRKVAQKSYKVYHDERVTQTLINLYFRETVNVNPPSETTSGAEQIATERYWKHLSPKLGAYEIFMVKVYALIVN